MNISKTIAILIGAALLSLGLWVGRSMGKSGTSNAVDQGESTQGLGQAEAEAVVWTCSMHPQVQLPEPGKCPICGMDLIVQSSDDGADDLGPSTLQISEASRALAEIETAKVERRKVAHEVNMVGKIALDETRMAYITSWVSGRLDRLFVDYTGVTVRKGDHLVEIYSPTLYSAQQELLQAIATAKKLDKSSMNIVRSTSDQTVLSAREKLRLYGLSEEQIQEIVDNDVPNEHVTILAPIGGIVVHKAALEGMYVKEGSQIYTIADLSKVWVLLEAYESDLSWLRYGQDVEFKVEAYPGETFHGRVAFIDPLLNDHTRTVKVRLNVDNSDARLKPDMFVSATANAVLTEGGKVVDENLAGLWMCPMHPEITSDGPDHCPECGMQMLPTSELGFVTQPELGESLVIPVTAALLTGKRAVVYVRLPDHDRPTYEGRVVDLGPRAGAWYVVHSGLRVGEEVVVKGNFKIDSELQIRARPSMMSPAGGAAPGVHNHGSSSASASQGQREQESLEEGPATLDPMEPGPVELGPKGNPPPAAFREQLGSVVDAYLGLQQAFATDQDGRTQAQNILDALSEVKMELLEGAGHMRWMEVLKGLNTTALAIQSTDDLEQQRAKLSPLTENLIAALKEFGYARQEGPVRVFHCPMALEGDGANWLQMGQDTKNPYFGSEMLGCGSLQETLPEEN